MNGNRIRIGKTMLFPEYSVVNKVSGLIKVRTKAGTYNQEYHHHALLLEFGTDQNKLEEVLYAGELFSDILVEVLKEEVN